MTKRTGGSVAQVTTQWTVRFRLDLPLMAKARPRFGNGRSFMPSRYVDWKKQARAQLSEIWVENSLPLLESFSIHVVAHGPGRSDGDNLIGALLDAGLPDVKSGFSGCWKDDRVTVLPAISFRWKKSKEQFWEVLIVS